MSIHQPFQASLCPALARLPHQPSVLPKRAMLFCSILGGAVPVWRITGNPKNPPAAPAAPGVIPPRLCEETTAAHEAEAPHRRLGVFSSKDIKRSPHMLKERSKPIGITPKEDTKRKPQEHQRQTRMSKEIKKRKPKGSQKEAQKEKLNREPKTENQKGNQRKPKKETKKRN